ncbi:MAG: DNA-protecting protein DprA [Deltaproteobacteria bacterium]|nr:DNA-protecting protein DprA [Deltaproteobacteria bacterium]
MKGFCKSPVHALAFHHFQNLSFYKKKLLIEEIGDFQKIFETPVSSLQKMSDLSAEEAYRIQNYKEFHRFEVELSNIQKKGIHLITYLDKKFPEKIRHIYDPPMAICVQGQLPALQQPSLAVVGSRQASFYGKSVTTKLIPDFIEAGFAIVSGGARGIDTQAHRIALENGGTTISILGCGLNQVYPMENKDLFQRISQHGCLVSEFSLCAFPSKQNFPQRNRLISALSDGVLVVEAGKKSGSLITARFALEQGKEVFAIPGPILSHHYEGTNHLLQDGATLVCDSSDIFLALGIDKKKNRSLCKDLPSSFEKEDLNSEDEKIWNTLTQGISYSVDEIGSMVDVQVPQIQETLMKLSLHGYIKEVHGKKFVKN